MKKIIAAIIGGSCIVGFLSGCSNESTQSSESRFNIVEYAESKSGTVSSFYAIWEDAETGVQYISFGNKGGSCVIVGKDGLPYTGNDEEG